MRDIRLDLFRVLCMYLICLIHAIGYVDSRWTHPLANISFAGVIGFVLISGYCGIRFTWFKVLKLEVTALYCAAFVTFIGELFGPQPSTLNAQLIAAISIWKSYWFIHAYVLLMCLAPLVTELGQRSEVKVRGEGQRSEVRVQTKEGVIQTFKHSNIQTFLPVILAVYGWSCLSLIPGIQSYIPRTPGLEAFSGITLFAVYLIGRLYRAYDGDRLSPWLVYPLALIGGLLAAVSGKCGLNWAGALARYNMPTLLFFAVGLFYSFRRMLGGRPALLRSSIQTFKHSNTQTFLSRFLSWILPSILPVYLLHCNPYGYKVLASLESRLFPLIPDPSLLVPFLILALVVFVGCILLDLPRRLLVVFGARVCRSVKKGS